MVQETSRRSIIRRLLSKTTARIASAVLVTGATLLGSPIFAQQNAPARYMPPVHVQPAAYSVLERGQQTTSNEPDTAGMTEQQIEAARSLEIARMSEYMRQQNESVTSAKDAQVNEALYRTQVARAQANYQAQTGYAAPVRPMQQPTFSPTQNVRPVQARPAYSAQRRQPQTANAASTNRNRVQTSSNRRMGQTRTSNQEAVPFGLQERLSKVIKKRFSRPKPAVEIAAAPVPTQAPPRQQAQAQSETRAQVQVQVQAQAQARVPSRAYNSDSHRAEHSEPLAERHRVPRQEESGAGVALVNHTLDSLDAEKVEAVAVSPRLNAPGHDRNRPDSWSAKAEAHSANLRNRRGTKNRTPRSVVQSKTRTQTQKRRTLEEVIVPSFIDTNQYADDRYVNDQYTNEEIQLTAAQDAIIGSGVQMPRVSARPRPVNYGAMPRQDVSVFQQASSPKQEGFTAPQDTARPSPEPSGQNSISPFTPRPSEDELPQRQSSPTPPSLLDMDDDNRDDARRARRDRDTEMDELEDETIRLDEDDDDIDDSKPPVFDSRGCEEFRSLLLDNSIRDISLDISPPASSRLREMDPLSREWTDAAGNVLASGTMIDLRRGYVILESGQKLPYAKLGEADWAAIADYWQLPSTCSIGQRGSLVRNWIPQSVTWHASSLCHKPLYFENRQLERYGHSRGPFMQPVQSTVHFFGSLFFLPYNTAINPPNECQYSLGFYRPGNCAPWLLDPIPFSREGIRRQALVATGLALIP